MVQKVRKCSIMAAYITKGGSPIKNRGLSQEGLKLIACLCMLVDHIGAVFLPYHFLRIIGRLAFPIYCFFLAEGAHYTKNPRKYALRLGVGVLLSELPYDILFYGTFTMQDQSVMLTLFIGFVMALCMQRVKQPLLQLILAVPFAFAAEWLHTDYGGLGVGLIALFVLTRDMPYRLPIQAVAMAAICYLMNSYSISVLGVQVPVQMFAVFSLVPIGLYCGRKVSHSRVVQWAFYLFYPAHLLVLYIVWLLLIRL